MNDLAKYIAAGALVLSLGLVGVPQAFAKGHDQGVADGDRDPGTSQEGGTGVGGTGGISGGVKGGTRGDGASDAGSDNSGDNGIGQGGASPDQGP